MSHDDDENLDDATTPFVKAIEPAEAPKKPVAVSDPYRSAGTVTKKPGPAAFGANFDAAKNRKAPPWAVPLFVALMGFEGVGFAAGWIKSIWDIERLDLQKSTLDLAVAPPPPPPPPPPPGGAKPHEVQITPKKVKVKELTQPVKQEKVENKVEESGDPAGVEGGEVGGVAGGVVGGDINGVAGAPPPPPPPPPPPAAPTNVAPTMLEGSRIAGEKMISPDDVTKTEISRSGKDKIVGSFKLCIDLNGGVSSVTMLKSTGFGAYDQKIQGKMRGEWRYRPYAVNGKAVPVCTAVTFIYSQK